MANIEQAQNALTTVIQQKDFDQFQTTWEELTLSHSLKNKLLMACLVTIYRLQGWKVVVPQGHKIPHLLLYHQTSTQPFIIVRWSANKAPINYQWAAAELATLEKELAPVYNCWQFNLVAPTGFESKVNDLRFRNLLLSDWQYLQRLIATEHPVVELLAHNQIAYENTVSLFETNRQVAVVQATGTGKTYLIARKIEDYANKKVLVLAPSHVILGQVEELVSWHDNVKYMTYAKTIFLTNEDLANLNPDLIVLDEFHRVGAEGWGGRSTKNFGCLFKS